MPSEKKPVSILKTKKSSKPKKTVKFSKFNKQTTTYSKKSYDRTPVEKAKLDRVSIKSIRQELNTLMDGLFIHPDSRKYTKKY